MRGAPITANNPSATGTAITSYSVTPALPPGLTLNTTTGVITGTPTTLSTAANYTVNALNGSVVSTSVQLNIAVVSPPSGLSYSTHSAVYPIGVPITANTPSVTGTSPITYSVTPTLPTGLNLDISTGVISGTPTAAQSATNYIVTAANTYGNTSVTLNITVLMAPSSLSYSQNTAQYVVGMPISSNMPTFTGSLPLTYSVSPALPSGLSLNTSTGVISGTPMVPAAAANYTVTATNAAGSTTKAVNITVILKPSGLSYSDSAGSYTVGTAITPNTPTVTGSSPLSYSVLPALPAGLTLNSSTGVISGTPTTATTTQTYSVTVSNAGGSASATISIVVNNTVGILFSRVPARLRIRTALPSVYMLPVDGRLNRVMPPPGQ
jgi:hypothetical protein